MSVDVKGLIKQQLAKYTPALLVWAGLTCVFLIIVIVLLSKVFLSGNTLTKKAIDDGQRAIVHIASGEVDGNTRNTKREDAQAGFATTNTTIPSSGGGSDAPAISKDGLAPAPLVTITEQSDKGPIPTIGRDGTLPWKYYARPYASKEKRPIVAVILTNLGLSKPQTDDVLTLPHNFTLSFSPYASDAKNWAKTAREEGFESFVDLPMKPDDYPMSDGGPYGLLDDLSTSENSARLHWILSRFPGFVGALAPINEKMTLDINAIRPTMLELSARGLLFVYIKTPLNTALAELSKTRGLYTLGVDVVIDKDITQAAIEKQLQSLVDTAKKQGYALGVAHSYPPTIDALNEWADTLATEGVELVPVSALETQLLH